MLPGSALPSIPKPKGNSGVHRAGAPVIAIDEPPIMSKELRTAQICGRGPLATGVGIFVVYLVAVGASASTHEGLAGHVIQTMMLSGLALLFVGPVLFCVGVRALAIHVRRGVTTAEGRQPAPPGPVLAAAAVLLSNFVAAYLILRVVFAGWSMTDEEYIRRLEEDPFPWTYTLLIQNTSGDDLTRARVVGCGPPIEIGDFEAGKWQKYRLSVEEACALHFEAQGPEADYNVPLDELHHWSRNTWTTLTLRSGGEHLLQSQKDD